MPLKKLKDSTEIIQGHTTKTHCSIGVSYSVPLFKVTRSRVSIDEQQILFSVPCAVKLGSVNFFIDV